MLLAAAFNASRHLDFIEFTVGRNGAHLFSTAPRSVPNLKVAKRLQTELRKRFPASEGFEVSAMRWTGPTYAECNGEFVTI